MTTSRLSNNRFAVVGLVLIGSMLGLLACELVVRLANIQPRIHVLYRENYRLSTNPVLKFELQPGSRDGRFRISSAGLRDREFDRQKPPGTYRIGIIGDSVTYGLTCGPNQTFAKQLEVLLGAGKPDGTRFEVLNLGVSGYNVDQIVERLRTLGISFDLDLVIYAYSLNDPQSFSLELQGLTAMKEEALKGSRPKDTLHRWLAGSRLYLLVWSAFQETWTQPVRPRHNSPDYEAVVKGEHVAYFQELHRGESWEMVQRGLSDMAGMAGGPGKPPRFVVAVFPVFLGTFETYPLAELHQRMVNEAQRLGLESLDLAPTYAAAWQSGIQSLFRDPFHPTPIGHRIAAFALLAWLRQADVLDEQTYLDILKTHDTRR